MPWVDAAIVTANIVTSATEAVVHRTLKMNGGNIRMAITTHRSESDVSFVKQ